MIFSGDMSLFKIFHLRQFCSPFVGLFWFVPGVVEVDEVPDTYTDYIKQTVTVDVGDVLTGESPVLSMVDGVSGRHGRILYRLRVLPRRRRKRSRVGVLLRIG